MRALGIGVVVVAGLAGLWWFTLASQTATCEVCVSFLGREACRTASGATADGATLQALVTACALVTAGVTEDLDCQRTPPKVLECR